MGEADAEVGTDDVPVELTAQGLSVHGGDHIADLPASPLGGEAGFDASYPGAVLAVVEIDAEALRAPQEAVIKQDEKAEEGGCEHKQPPRGPRAPRAATSSAEKK